MLFTMKLASCTEIAFDDAIVPNSINETQTFRQAVYDGVVAPLEDNVEDFS